MALTRINTKWRIGLNLSNLFWFISYGIREPFSYTFNPYSAQHSYSTGKVKTSGYNNLVMEWDTLMPHHFQILNNLVENARSTQDSVLYMTVKNTEQGLERWQDVHGYVAPLSYETTSPQADGTFYLGVTLTLNNVIIDNVDSEVND